MRIALELLQGDRRAHRKGHGRERMRAALPYGATVPRV
jgi:hypothetical protein